ncbi:MAG TPA: hypothetical protein EYH43_06605 [Persephonella sp.]|nr:hypothetical protein [Hydrogenothermaceae bacterium]HIQ25632.1 hypothetical protein [Persephonella sp.]
MKKFLKTAIFGASIVGITFSSSVAGELMLDEDGDYTTYEDAITVAAEAAPALGGQNYDLDPSTNTPLGNTIGRTILYKAGITLNEGDKVRFRLTNATFADQNYYLIVCESINDRELDGDNAGDAGYKSECFELGNIVGGGNGEDYVTLRIAKPPGVTVDNNTIYILSANNDTSGNTYQTGDNITIRLDDNINASSNVSISVDLAEDVGGTALDLAEADPINIITWEKQFAISFDKGNSTIDVSAASARKKFVEEGNANDILISNEDTDELASSGRITIYNDSDSSVEDYITLDANDTLEVTLGDNSTDRSAWDYGGNRVFIDWDDTNNTGDQSGNDGGNDKLFDPNTHTASIPGNKLPDHGHSLTEDVYLGVDGQNILNQQTIPISATLSFDEGYDAVTASDNEFITWRIGGYQAIIPYGMNGVIGASCIINNNASSPADIYVDVLTAEGISTIGSLPTNLNLGSLDGKESGILVINGDKIKLYVNGVLEGSADISSLGENRRYSLRLTVTADNNSVYISCSQKVEGEVGSRNMPIYTNQNDVNWRY